MKFGIMTDIHSNLPALKACVEKFNNLSCDYILCCGDIIGIGPMPEETTNYIKEIKNLIAIKGNHEVYPFDYDSIKDKYDEEIAFYKWERNSLSPESKSFLTSLPFTKRIEVDGITISLIHYSTKDMKTYNPFCYELNFEVLKDLFKNVDSDIIIYGHEHGNNITHNKNKWFINTGSLGCPMKDSNEGKAAILTIENNNITLEELIITYDVSEVLNAYKSRNIPGSKVLAEIFFGKKI